MSAIIIYNEDNEDNEDNDDNEDNEDNEDKEFVCNRCNTTFNKTTYNLCTPEQCDVFETCEGCGIDINCHRDNLHILAKDDNPCNNMVYCKECCYNRDECDKIWICDECDDNTSDIDEIPVTEVKTLSITNKGTGAGGANTNYYGKKFEEKTNRILL